MPFRIPPPPITFNLQLPRVVRLLPLSRRRLPTGWLLVFTVASAIALAASILAGLIVPTLLLDLQSLGCIGAPLALGLPLLLYRWIVVCPQCGNGYFEGHALDWRCSHCGLNIDADAPRDPASPWGAR